MPRKEWHEPSRPATYVCDNTAATDEFTEQAQDSALMWHAVQRTSQTVGVRLREYIVGSSHLGRLRIHGKDRIRAMLIAIGSVE